MGLASWIGKRVLPFQNARVVAPPGRLRPNGRPAIVVATPMRSGTHILIDLILNNLPAYRRTPLYADLDQFIRQARAGKRAPLDPADLAGHVVKTHFPTGHRETEAERAMVEDIAAEAIVLTVERPVEAIRKSMARWSEDDGGTVWGRRMTEDLETRFEMFHAFWRGRADLALHFDELFDPARMAAVLDQLAAETATARGSAFMSPPSQDRVARIHLDKALTRLLGARAPRVDTTIHTLKKRGR